MMLQFTDLCDKQVINLKDGCRLGFVDDLVIDCNGAKVLSLVIRGRNRLFGLLGKEEDLVIDWDNIKVFGEDAILVHLDRCGCTKERKSSLFTRFFH